MLRASVLSGVGAAIFLQIRANSAHAKKGKSSMMSMNSECPLCAMVKAGPCRELFYPFEDCLKQCEKNDDDAQDACMEQFMDMMRCMGEHLEEYKAIETKMNEDETRNRA